MEEPCVDGGIAVHVPIVALGYDETSRLGASSAHAAIRRFELSEAPGRLRQLLDVRTACQPVSLTPDVTDALDPASRSSWRGALQGNASRRRAPMAPSSGASAVLCRTRLDVEERLEACW
jgi:hypothetical protein